MRHLVRAFVMLKGPLLCGAIKLPEVIDTGVSRRGHRFSDEIAIKVICCKKHEDDRAVDNNPEPILAQK